MAEGDRGFGGNRDLVIPPNTYAYVLATTTGKINVWTGPSKTSLSETDRLVIWTGARFDETNMERAVTPFAKAGEGQYLILENPAREGSHPRHGASDDVFDLEIGRKVNVPGPANFALWPGQVSRSLDGHHLRHNQYLLVRVYDALAAQENWGQAVVASQGDQEAEVTAPQSFVMGQLMVIQGTDVSFYIPPTGIEVVQDESTGSYVREAVTLERLEYCILLDESGDKRYVQGPDVVFPSPTEKFVRNDTSEEIVAPPGVTPRTEKARKFRAFELNDHSGLYIKVIADYVDADNVEHRAGDEMFITGATTPIYFPRAEHSIIRYGDRQVHYAIAIPEGEGRYVLNRDMGEVKLVKGPEMFLPNPITEVVVLRTLSDKMVELLYPGNTEARAVNEEYRLRSAETARDRSPLRAAAMRSGTVGTTEGHDHTHESILASSGSNVAFAGDSFSRGTTYNQPRSITLDTKYDGAVTINIWPGYAILVTDRAGGRRVEVGPKTVLLEYDEIVQPVELSTGRPKTDTRLLKTAYLRVGNNTVSDMVMVQTRDLVDVQIELSYRATFEGETEEEMISWFDVENYVKFMTDHARSRLRNEAKRKGIAEFYSNTIDIVRDALLKPSTGDGQPREGLFFGENQLRIYDVEVLDVRIPDEQVANMLESAQETALRGALEVSLAEDAASRRVLLEGFKRQEMTEVQTTATLRSQIDLDQITRTLESNMARLAADLSTAAETNEVAKKRLEMQRTELEQEISFDVLRDEQRMRVLTAETEEFVKRVAAVDQNLVAALQNFGELSFTEALVKAVGPVAMSTGVTSGDLLKQVFDGTPFAGILETLTERPLARRALVDHDINR